MKKKRQNEYTYPFPAAVILKRRSLQIKNFNCYAVQTPKT